MGVMYYLAREDNRTLFEIGKFTEISELFLDFGNADQGWAPRCIPREDELAILIRRAIESSELSVDKDAYAGELARRVSIFCGGHSVAVLNDSSSDFDRYGDKDGALCVVDSAYTSGWGWVIARSLPGTR
jgi:hypothetical protein